MVLDRIYPKDIYQHNESSEQEPARYKEEGKAMEKMEKSQCE